MSKTSECVPVLQLPTKPGLLAKPGLLLPPAQLPDIILLTTLWHMVSARPQAGMPRRAKVGTKAQNVNNPPTGQSQEGLLKALGLTLYVRLTTASVPTTSSAPKSTQKVGEGAKTMTQSEDSTGRNDRSIPFSILDLKAQAVRLPISKAAQILLSELLTWAGERGYCWWAVPRIAKDLRWSVSVVWRKATELKQAGLLEVIPRPGRSNFWVPLPGPAKMQRVINETTPLATPRVPFLKENEKLKRCTVEQPCASTNQVPSSPSNVNAIKNCSQQMAPLTGTIPDIPPQSKPIQHKPTPPISAPKPKTKAPMTPDHLFLVEEIERVTEDTWSRGHFFNIVRQTDEQTIYAALSVTREKRSLESGVNLGAYFTSTLKGMTGLASLAGKSPVGSITQQSCPAHVSMDTPARPTPRFVLHDEPEPEPLDPESLKKGWRLQHKAVGVQGMLSLVQRCVPPCVDVRSLWVDVRETFPGMEEIILINRLLDTVVTRMKHAEKTAEVRV